MKKNTLETFRKHPYILPCKVICSWICLWVVFFGCTVKIFYRIPVFFLPNLSDTGKSQCWQGIFWCPPEKGFSVLWGGNNVPLTAGVIFSLLLDVIFPYFPYFPIIFTGKLMEDSWLATGVPGRVAIKFGHWEKNLAPFVKLSKLLKCQNQWKF